MTAPQYYPDLKTITLNQFKERLITIRLLSSQQLLLDDIDERFSCLVQHGITNLEQLQRAIKTKSDVQAFAALTGLPFEYLVVLRRQVNGIRPKPIDLKDFPGVNMVVIHKLEKIGIRNTAQLFPYVLTPQDRTEFSDRNQIPPADLLQLTKLTDVARLKWAGPIFARLLVASEYDTVEKILNANVEELYHALVQTNAAKGIYNGKFKPEDLETWVDTVRDTPLVIQY